MTTSCFAIAKLAGTSRHRLQKHVKRWFEEGVIVVEGAKNNGQGSPRYGEDNHVVKKQHLQAIASCGYHHIHLPINYLFSVANYGHL